MLPRRPAPRVLAEDEPGRRLRLASHAYIRGALRKALPGVRVSQEAVEAVAAELDRQLEELVQQARGRYERELLARHVHGTYPKGWLRAYHLTDPRPPLLDPVPHVPPDVL